MITPVYRERENVMFPELAARARAIRPVPFAMALTDQAASSGATFLTGAIVARSCSKGDFGTLVLSLIAVAWCTNVQSAFITTPFIYARPRLCEEERREHASNTLLIQLLYSTAVTALCFGLALVWEHFDSGQSSVRARGMLTLLGTTIFCLLLKEYCRQMAYAAFEIGSAALLNSAVAVLQVGGLLLLARDGLLTLRTAYWCMAAAYMLPSVAWLGRHRREFDLHLTTVPGTVIGNYRFGRWLLGGYVLNVASRDSFSWLVTASGGAAATGTFSAGMGVASLVAPAVSGVSNALGPLFARAFAGGGIAAVARRASAVSQLVTPCAVCYCLVMMAFGEHLVTAIYGARYTGAGTLVAIVALSVTATAVSMPTGVALYALGRADVNFRAARSAVAAVVLIGIPLVVRFGALGAAVGLACGTVVESVYKIRRFRGLLCRAVAIPRIAQLGAQE